MQGSQRPILLLRHPEQESIPIYVYANLNGEAWLEYHPNLRQDKLQKMFEKQSDILDQLSLPTEYTQVYRILNKPEFMARNLDFVKSYSGLVSDYLWHQGFQGALLVINAAIEIGVLTLGLTNQGTSPALSLIQI